MCRVSYMDKPFYISDIDEHFLRGEHGEIYSKAVGTLEKLLIEKALERTGGNQIEAARMLGLHRNTLRMKIKDLNISVEKFKR